MVASEIKKVDLKEQLTDLRAEVELAGRIADRSADVHLKEHVAAAAILVVLLVLVVVTPWGCGAEPVSGSRWACTGRRCPW